MSGRHLFLAPFAMVAVASAQDYAGIPTEPKPGDKMLAAYFEAEVQKLGEACLAEVRTADDWAAAQGLYREQLFEMLGIPSRRQRTALNAEVTGSQVHDGIVVENVVFQSLPKLYVTANFYRPAGEIDGPLPAILYACGHSHQKSDGISFGNKTGYHHHGVWFAKNGYACLTIDTIQLGEIEGLHHGTYREGRWWWNSRGYSPAGVEAWNGIRALDYLGSRPEVDGERIGMTGRSGGGAYTWWVSALDERVKVAVPVAGITSLHNHVVDGVVEGHCDCMFHVNTHRWDFAQVAALVAPRPLLIANTDKDGIFPLDGVVDVYTKTRRIYELGGAGRNIGLAIAEGPHKDTQPLRSAAFHWFERHLKGAKLESEVDTLAPKVLDRATLRALEKAPEDEIVTRIDEFFVATAPTPPPPADGVEWGSMRDAWMASLREKVFGGWPGVAGALNVAEVKPVRSDRTALLQLEFDSQGEVRLPLVVAVPADAASLQVVVVGEDDWGAWSRDGYRKLRDEAGESAVALLAPRGVGPTAWTGDARERVQIRRRFMLLGQTLDGMRVWDIRRGLSAIREVERVGSLPLHAEASGTMAANLLYASLFEDGIASLTLDGLAPSHSADGAPDYLNVLRYLDLPAAAAMAATRCPIKATSPADADRWRYVGRVLEAVGKPAERFQLVE